MQKILYLLLLIIPGIMPAQERWSLQRCIGHAQDNNLTIRQAQANVAVTQLSEKQAKAARLPSINANSDFGEQFGRTIDPSTNAFREANIAFNSMSLNANIALFNGGQNYHNIQQAKINTQAAELDLQQTANNLALQVASGFLSVLQNTELLVNAQNRTDLSRKQLANTQKLIDAGNLPAAEKFTILAQIAREEQAAITAQNNLDLAYLNLKQLLQLEPDYPMEVERPVFNVTTMDPDNLNLSAVYNDAANSLPVIKASEMRILSAKKGIDIARSAYYPSLSAFGNIRSNFSSAAVDFFPNGGIVPGQTLQVEYNGVQGQIIIYTEDGDLKNTPYFTQIDRNFGQGVGVSLSIPIYQNGRTRLAVEQAKLNVVNSELQANQARQQLKNDIQTAIASAKSAKKQLEAAQRTYDATQIAFTNAEKRLGLGAITTIELFTARNNLDIAQNDLTVAKYDYVFRQKILDFYLGKPLTL
jgi:outer membrane protein